MNTRMLLTFGMGALVLGGSMVGCTAKVGGIASAGTREAAAGAKVAARDADEARKALAKGQAGMSVRHAEAAVALMPQNAGYRALLGQGYLKAGRFKSAQAAFTDALALEPNDPRTALNLALAQTALGDWQAARTTLDAHAGTIPAADRGLALALSGDPEGGAKLLTEVIKGGHATPTVRQNLALTLALAGQWQAARVVAAVDMSPAELDRRLEQWAGFAKPKASSDQVAALLGVAVAEDPGQPVTLALAAAVPVGGALAAVPTQQAETPAVAVAEPVAPAAAPAPVLLVDLKPSPVPVTPLIQAAPQPVKVAVTRRAAVPAAVPKRTSGDWYVQVGAFRNAAVAQDGWRHATRRMPALARHTPSQARFAAKGGAFYRLAFGGFSRGDADATCRRYRQTGGVCFVRAAAGDQVASWVTRSVQVAVRTAPVKVALRSKPVQLASR